jgi:hypothetical protein
VENFDTESEFVAMRMIQAALGAWIALRAHEKWGHRSRPNGQSKAAAAAAAAGGSGGGSGASSLHPAHPLWRRMPETYRVGVLAMRDARLRNLGLLAKIVRRQRPLVKLVEYLKKQSEYNAGRGRGNGSAASDMMSLSTDSMVRDLDVFDGDGGFHNPLVNEDDDGAAVAARGAAAGAGEGGDGAPAAPESV